MMFERLDLCFRGPCSRIQHNKTIRKNLELCSNIQIEISQLETAKCSILYIYPWPWNDHPAMTIIPILF